MSTNELKKTDDSAAAARDDRVLLPPVDVVEGWDRLRQSAAGALTRYRPGDKSNLPAREDIDDASWLPGMGWAMIGGDVFEDERRVVVRLEAPGMAKSGLIAIQGDHNGALSLRNIKIRVLK